MSLPLFVLGLLQISVHAQTYTAPEAIIEAPNDNPVTGEIGYDVGDSYRGSGDGYQVSSHEGDGAVYGFSFDNKGANAIIPTQAQIGAGPMRTYEFEFTGRSRQDIQMHVTDTPDEFLSHLMESYIYFFPRKNLPAIQWPTADMADQSKFNMILPTGETVVFDKESKMIVGGVMSETRAIDLNPDRFSRKFAGLSYTGTGVMLRVDKRGNDPRFGNTATITFGTKKCNVASNLLFNQDQSSSAQFLFATDEAFNTFLKNKCRFSFL